MPLVEVLINQLAMINIDFYLLNLIKQVMSILMITMYSNNICLFFPAFLFWSPRRRRMETNNHRRRSDISVLFSHLPGSGSVVSLWGDASIFNGIKQSIKACHSSSFQAGFWNSSSPAGPEALSSGCTRALQWFNHERAPGQQQTLYD